MKEETYLKAKVIMDEIERLRELKKFTLPPECYSVSFSLSSGAGVVANSFDIGQMGMKKIINTYIGIIDDLIVEKLQKLEELQ